MTDRRRFLFRLALALGKTVAQLLAEISSRELSEWRAYFLIEPFGEERADLRMGILASVTANSQGNKTRPADFMPRFEGESGAAGGRKSAEDLAAFFKALSGQNG